MNQGPFLLQYLLSLHQLLPTTFLWAEVSFSTTGRRRTEATAGSQMPLAGRGAGGRDKNEVESGREMESAHVREKNMPDFPQKLTIIL